MYAIIQTGGKQYKVEQGQTLYIEKLNAAEGETVPAFPVHTDGSEDFILGMSEALAILDLFRFHNVGKAVHFTEGHSHTFQSRSSRRSRLTVFHTCCAAPVLSAKKPPVLPSRLS